MSTTPLTPGTKAEISDREKQVVEQRLATFEEDWVTAVDAREALATIRQNLKHPSPR